MAFECRLAAPAVLALHGPEAPLGLSAEKQSSVLPVGILPIGPLVAKAVPEIGDAAGGAMVLVASGDKSSAVHQGVLNTTWAALLLLEDAAGFITWRAIRGARFVLAIEKAQIELVEARRHVSPGQTAFAELVAAAAAMHASSGGGGLAAGKTTPPAGHVARPCGVHGARDGGLGLGPAASAAWAARSADGDV